ncbi:MAG: hypothetical protein ACI9VR_003562 [Cognaticolwellia sp.]|jgi:hypothetical protein
MDSIVSLLQSFPARSLYGTLVIWICLPVWGAVLRWRRVRGAIWGLPVLLLLLVCFVGVLEQVELMDASVSSCFGAALSPKAKALVLHPDNLRIVDFVRLCGPRPERCLILKD